MTVIVVVVVVGVTHVSMLLRQLSVGQTSKKSTIDPSLVIVVDENEIVSSVDRFTLVRASVCRLILSQ